MASAANVSVVGHLGREAETRYTPNGALNVQMTVAVNRKAGGQDVANWYRVSAWGKLGETLNDLAEDGALQKGDPVYVAGELTVREYTDRNGNPGYSLDVFATTVQLLGRRGDGAGGRDRLGGNDDGSF